MPLLSGNGVGVFDTDTEEVNVVELNVVNVVEGEETVTGKDVVTVVSWSQLLVRPVTSGIGRINKHPVYRDSGTVS